MTTNPSETLDSGCVRQTTNGRGAYELMSPFVSERDAKLFEWGASHRGSRNWEMGCPFSRCVQSLQRHLYKWMMREPDEDHDDNLAAIRFWAGAIMHYEAMIERGVLPETLDDMPKYEGQVEFGTAFEECKQDIIDDLSIKELHVKKGYVHLSKRPEPIDESPNDKNLEVERIYVAGPISATSIKEMEANNARGQQIARQLQARGHLVFCPMNYEPGHVGPSQYEDLLELDFSIIRQWATSLFFIGSSPGADRELAVAKAQGHTIYYYMKDVPQLPRQEQDCD